LCFFIVIVFLRKCSGGQWCRRYGGMAVQAHPKSLICWKSGKNAWKSGKIHETLCKISENLDKIP